jgi:hypothetical protein
MLNKSNPLLSKAELCRYCIQSKALKLNHFKVVNAIGFKSYKGDRQAGDLISLLLFLESRLKM